MREGNPAGPAAAALGALPAAEESPEPATPRALVAVPAEAAPERAVWGWVGRLVRPMDGPHWAWVTRAIDLALLGVAALAAQALTPDGNSVRGAATLLVIFPLGGTVTLALARTRARRMKAGVLDDLWPVIAAISVAAMLSAAVGRIVAGNGLRETTLVETWAIAVLALCVRHAVGRVGRRQLRLRGLSGRPTLIVGAGEVGARIGRWLHTRPEYGLRPVGFLDWSPPAADTVGGRPVPIVGLPSDLGRLVRTTGARHVVLAFVQRPDRQLVPLMDACHELGVEVSVVPRLFEHTNDRMTYEPVGGLPLLAIDLDPGRESRLLLKHGLDRLAGVAGLVLAAPLLGAVALALVLTSGRPVIYRQRRLGDGGREFDLLKFRTMHAAPAVAPGRPRRLPTGRAPGGVEGEDRRTALGRLLRRTSLDELPQLVNVARGDMSLVGPRPERPHYAALFSDSLERYAYRHRMRPGITGLAQVSGLRGATSLEERVELDIYYIDHWSLTLDAKILMRTVQAAFRVPE